MTDSLSTLLKKYNLHPRKGLGQNFLTDPLHLQKIVDAAELSPHDTVLEIGPGPGTLTRLLAEAAGQAIAVELDPNMVTLLKNEYDHLPNLTVVKADILQVSIPELFSEVSNQWSVISNQKSVVSNQKNQNSEPACPRQGGTRNSELKIQNSKFKIQNYKVVANLPYYITSAVLRHLLEADPQPQRLVVTVQKEVAQRIVAEPGDMSVLAVSVRFYGQPTIVHRIPAGAFYPPPKVDSAVVRVDTYSQPPVAVQDVDFFFRVAKAGFSQKRKQLKNSLAGGLRQSKAEIVAALEQANIEPTRRAETLGMEEWGRLVEALQQ